MARTNQGKIKLIEKNKSWKQIDLLEKKSLISTRWIFKTKLMFNKNTKKLKVHVVA